jgi:hypothetical protein
MLPKLYKIPCKLSDFGENGENGENVFSLFTSKVEYYFFVLTIIFYMISELIYNISLI